MKSDEFRQILEKKGFKVVYTNNKKLALSCKIINGKYTIYANRVFSNCDEKIAYAVMELYVSENEYAYNLIIQFIKEYNSNYRIRKSVENQSETELIIKEISVSRFNNHKELIQDQTIRVDQDDTVEVDIIVDGK